MTLDSRFVVAGIDVGGDRKGCHLVILRGREIIYSIVSKNPDEAARICVAHGVLAVGIDSPCKWGTGTGGRMAERELARNGIFSFSTPTRERALANASGFYGWMFNGERIYRSLASSYPLLADPHYSGGQVCFETFPHAITCALLGRDIASAKKKRVQRRQLVEDFGIETRTGNCPLRSIDAVDAALCALTASCVLHGATKAYGDSEGGWIVVPDRVEECLPQHKSSASLTADNTSCGSDGKLSE